MVSLRKVMVSGQGVFYFTVLTVATVLTFAPGGGVDASHTTDGLQGG